MLFSDHSWLRRFPVLHSRPSSAHPLLLPFLRSLTAGISTCLRMDHCFSDLPETLPLCIRTVRVTVLNPVSWESASMLINFPLVSFMFCPHLDSASPDSLQGLFLWLPAGHASKILQSLWCVRALFLGRLRCGHAESRP